MEKYILQVNHLEVGFEEQKGFEPVVKDISFGIKEGEILGIVGESGSGKSITSLAIMDLLKENAVVRQGEIWLEGKDLLTMSQEEKRKIKGNQVAMVFQEPMTSLNPLMTVGKQVEEVLKIHNPREGSLSKERVLTIFEDVGLPNPSELYVKYPHQLSGGMRQRVMIAMAMICKPKLLIADEPTTALDVTVQKQILLLLKRLNEEFRTSILFISHDLAVVKSLCNRTLVMNEGQIVEEGTGEELFSNPKEEYTKRLLQAVPKICRQSILEEPQGRKNVVCNVDKYSVFYEERGKTIFSKKIKKRIVKDVSFQIQEGEIFGIVGESGSGKSTLAKAIVGLTSQTEGMKELTVQHPQMVFQDPYSSLNPSKTIEAILREPLRIQRTLPKKEQTERVFTLLEEVGLSREYAKRHIRELSGGQRQRVAIALALITNAKFIVLDEPVSALDVTIQDQIITLLRKLQKTHRLTYLFISHDLNVVYQLCDRIAVMKDGKIVELGTKDDVYFSPKEEYTKRLLNSIITE